MNTVIGMPSNSLSSVDSANGTDLPVLLPVAAQARKAALIERREGTYRLNVQPRHLLWVTVIFIFASVAAQAAAQPGLITPMAALFKWMPLSCGDPRVSSPASL